MATIKSYTDLKQSKKLAEILPLESADMYYTHGAIVPDIMIGSKQDYRCYTICWSLAALYNILPNTEYNSTTLSRGGWKIEPPEYVDTWFCEYEDGDDCTRDITVEADNPVNACYEMIIKLHKLNLL